MSFFLLTETGDQLLLEDGSGAVLLEAEAVGCALAQETGDRLLLEDGTVLLLENCDGPPPEPPPAPGPPPPSWGSGLGGSIEPKKIARSSDTLIKQLYELKRMQELKIAAEREARVTTVRFTPPRAQRQLVMLLPYFIEVIESWDPSAAASNG